MSDISRRAVLGSPLAGLIAVQADTVAAQTQSTCPAVGARDEDARGEPGRGVGMALSGGGYKAAVFHLGSLKRLNELGALRQLTTVSSVSGGSITAAAFAMGWSKLAFNAQNGVAENFDQAVVMPLMRFCRSETIDIPSFLRGVGPFSSAPHELSKAYKALCGDATLADLPDPETGAPEFIFNTTNMERNSRFSFSRREAYDHDVGSICWPLYPLAKVVAASSAFPPLFAPHEFELGDAWATTGEAGSAYRGRVALADGGIYDNMGLEPIWKRHKVLLVSNAGDPFPDDPTPPHEWFSQMRRVIRMMHRQAENNRKRWLIERASDKITAEPYRQTVALWQIQGTVDGYKYVNNTLPAPGNDLAANQKVRLKALTLAEAQRLYQHGYSMADAAVRSFWGPFKTAAAPTFLPLCPV